MKIRGALNPTEDRSRNTDLVNFSETLLALILILHINKIISLKKNINKGELLPVMQEHQNKVKNPNTHFVRIMLTNSLNCLGALEGKAGAF